MTKVASPINMLNNINCYQTQKGCLRSPHKLPYPHFTVKVCTARGAALSARSRVGL